MKRTAIGLACLLLTTLVFTACGDDDAGDTTSATAAPTTAAAPTTTAAATTTTAAPTTTAAATTTTAAPTTTEATTTTTTLPDDSHAVYGYSWREVWRPTDGATAAYQIDGGDILPARFDHDVEFQDATWDVFIVGTAEEGSLGSTIYLRSPEPWVVEFGGWEYYRPDAVTREWYDPPVVFDARGAMLEPMTFETTAFVEFGGVSEFGAEFTFYIGGPIGVRDTPLGPLPAAEFRIDTSGELMGGGFVFETTVWLNEGQWMVEVENGPAWANMVLVEPWTP